jgi:hypothetical protein
MRLRIFAKLGAGACLPSALGGWGAAPLAVAVLAVTSPAASQPAQAVCSPPAAEARGAIAVGSCVRSTIGPEDARTDSPVPYEEWRLPLQAGETVQIDMDAIVPERRAAATGAAPRAAGSATQQAAEPPAAPLAFDTDLELRGPGSDDPVAINDDRGGGSLNSTIRFTAPAAAVYTIRARPLYGEGGPYTLRISRPPALQMVAITAGRTRAAVLPGGEGAAYSSGLFTFEGAEGERVRIAVTSGAADVMMILGPVGGNMLGLTQSTTSGNASLFAILPRRQLYQVEVQVPSSAEPTPITLDMERRVADVTLAPRRIRVGEALDGELGFDSRVLVNPYGVGSDPSLYELYTLDLQGGRPVTVSLESTDFDSLLEAGVGSPFGFAVAASDDDGGGGLNSRLVLRPSATGTAQLRVRGMGSGAGRFRLRVAAGDVPPPANDAPALP